MGQTGAVPGTNGPPPRDKMGPVPGINRPFSVEFHSRIAILSRLSLGRVAVRPWDDCPARAVRKMFMCFLFIVFFFFRPQFLGELFCEMLAVTITAFNFVAIKNYSIQFEQVKCTLSGSYTVTVSNFSGINLAMHAGIVT